MSLLDNKQIGWIGTILNISIISITKTRGMNELTLTQIRPRKHGPSNGHEYPNVSSSIRRVATAMLQPHSCAG